VVVTQVIIKLITALLHNNDVIYDKICSSENSFLIANVTMTILSSGDNHNEFLALEIAYLQQYLKNVYYFQNLLTQGVRIGHFFTETNFV